MARRTFVPSALALMLLALWTACDKSPTQNSQPPHVGGPTSSAAVLTTFVITGPNQVMPGATAQFTATGTFSDGTTQDLTSSVAWIATNQSVMSRAAAGAFTATVRGESDIWAYSNPYRRESQHIRVLVLEPDRYKLSGHIVDQGGDVVTNASIQVEAGTGEGLTTQTKSDGSFAIYGVAGDVQLRIAAGDNYGVLRTTLHVAQNMTTDLTLNTAVPAADISGAWTLTVVAGTSCSPIMPNVARRLEYHVEITQHAGTAFAFVVSGPTVVHTATFSGRILGNAPTVTLTGGYDDYYGGEYDLLDRLGVADLIGVYGTITGTLNGSQITGKFDGEIDYFQTTSNGPYLYPMAASCKVDPTLILRR